MNRQLLSSLSILAVIAAATSPALALSERHQDEFINGLGNKAIATEAALSERHQDEFINGLGNKLSERTRPQSSGAM